MDRCPQRRLPQLASAAITLAAFMATALVPAAHAETSPYCRKVQARSASEAALLMSPELVVRGLRFPWDPTLALEPTDGPGFQVRAGLSFSPLDFYRGLRVLSLGEADCAAQASRQFIDELFERGEDGVRLAALQQEIAFLEAHRPEWQAILTTTEQRLAAKVVSLLDFDEIDRQAAELERRLNAGRGEARRLEARLPVEPPGSPSLLRQLYAERTLGFEREESHLRTLDAWEVGLTGGMAATERSLGWFGTVEVSFKPGAFVQWRHEDHYLEARADELKSARYEGEQRLLRREAEAQAAREQTERDLARVQKQLDTLDRTRVVLECSESPNSTHARDQLSLERLTVQADEVYLRAMLEALSAY
jgi:hypothetical protein